MTRRRRQQPAVQADPDLSRALKTLRSHFGADEVIVLTVTPHTDRAALERASRTYVVATLFEEEED